MQQLSSKADVVFLIPNLGFCHLWRIGFLSLRRRVTAIRLKIHRRTSRQNISIPADSVVCLWPCDRSEAGCHVSDWPVWERTRPKIKKKKAKRGLFVVAPKRVCGRCKHNVLTEPGWWCSACGGPNQVSPPVRCGSAFCQRQNINKKGWFVTCETEWESGDVCPGKGLHTHGRTYSSVSRRALVKTAASSACSLLWLRSLRKQGEARLYMAAKTKSSRSDRGDVQLSKKKKKWRGFMKARILLHPKTRIKTWWWATVQKAKPNPWEGSR